MKKLILLLVVAALGLGGFKIYHAMQQGGIAGDAAVAEFHEMMNSARDAEIYEKGSAAFRAGVTKENFQKFLTRLRTDAGQFKHGTRQAVNVSNVNGNTTLVIGCDATFEKGHLEEHFVFDDNADKPVLIRYDVKKLMGSTADAP